MVAAMAAGGDEGQKLQRDMINTPARRRPCTIPCGQCDVPHGLLCECDRAGTAH